MSKIMTILADAEALLALQPEDLGLILLNLVQQERKKMVTRSEFEMPLWNANSPNYPHQKRDFVGRAFAEAWQWLENEGLLMSEPTQSGGYYCLTRKGAALKSSADVDAYRHGNVLHPALLHPTLAEKVRPMFLRGDYDVAVFQAFKEVEVAVRKATSSPNGLVGVRLMREAFKPENGPLTDPESDGGERVALMELYAGAMGHCKNPTSHRNVGIERVSAAQLIALASNLLMKVEEIVASNARSN